MTIPIHDPVFGAPSNQHARDHDGQPTIRLYSAHVDKWFTARYLAAGEQAHSYDRYAHKPRVMFYDATYATNPNFDLGLGQYTGGSYHVDSLQANPPWNGLQLASVDEWVIDGPAVVLLMAWLVNVGSAA